MSYYASLIVINNRNAAVAATLAATYYKEYKIEFLSLYFHRNFNSFWNIFPNFFNFSASYGGNGIRFHVEMSIAQEFIRSFLLFLLFCYFI